MNISSTPFIRNDYWPDYNDINQLNQRINEVENELSLTNIRLSTDIENVSNNLNSYTDNQANTTIANNIIVNNINANYAVGKFVNFGNANFNNAYVENLTVNKPVFDITLNTPHIENVTSLGGNIYDANLFNVSITGGDVAFNNVSIDDLTAANATISNLFVNTQPEPVQSSAVLGYDSQGRVIPIEAVFDVGLPENANYLFTDTHGTAFAGVAATEVSTINNLITAQAVQNGFNDINANVQNGFNDINANVQNGFNDINANVQNGFNDINANVQNGFNDINANVQNGFNDINANVQNIYDILNNTLGFNLQLNYINSTSPVNYQNVQQVVFTAGQIGNVWCDTPGKMGTQYYDWNPSTNTLTFSSMTGIVTFNTNMDNTFSKCTSLNQNILIPNSVTTMNNTFNNCTSLNQNILIPNSVTTMSGAFINCTSLNQNILIPNSVTTMSGTFGKCENLNQNILIPNSVTTMSGTFINCTSLNQNILIPNSVTDLWRTFYNCISLNQNILIPNSVTTMNNTFNNCTSLNQNILIPNSVTTMNGIFSGCTSLNQNILVPNSVTTMENTFSNCTSLNQNIYIYSENLSNVRYAFNRCTLLTDKYIHIRSSIPMDRSNAIYNGLVDNNTGINWTGRVINDLEEPTQWPPV